MDRFLLCKNPNRPEASGLFILHRLEPRCLIEVTKQGNEWIFSIADYYDTKDTEERYEKVIVKARYWFKAYLVSVA